MQVMIDIQPGEPAPASGLYRQIDAVGSQTQIRVLMTRGDPLPDAPQGCGWRRQREDEGAGAPAAVVARYRQAPSLTRTRILANGRDNTDGRTGEAAVPAGGPA
jgi:hypothetical protein